MSRPNRWLSAAGLIALLGALLAVPAQAQDSRIRQRLDPATAGRVTALLDSARAQGLPTEPLVQKALEGESKGAPSPRIVAAVEALLTGLGQARLSLGERASDDELVAGALWLRAGGAAGELARLRAGAPSRSLAVPLVVSADLVARGWPIREAFADVERLLEAGVTDRDFLSLRSQVDRAVMNGESVSDAVRREVSRLRPERQP